MASSTNANTVRPSAARGRNGRHRNSRRRGRRSRLLTRGLPALLVLVAVTVAAVGFVLYEAGSNSRHERTLVRQYLGEWANGDWSAMYGMLSTPSKATLSRTAFTNAYVNANDTATVTSIAFARRVVIRNDMAQAAATIVTSSFGTLHETVDLHLEGDGAHLIYSPAMVFPGLRAGEKLTRTSQLGARGTIEASDGTALAEGPDRTSPIPAVATQIVGALGPIPAAQRSYYRSLGYPANAQVGQYGLEEIFQRSLAGTPGGTLLAGPRTLAKRAPLPGKTVHTTISPTLEQDAAEALGQSYSGMVVLDLKTGGIEAAVGQAFTDLQPPGSTFKIITAAAALQYGVAKVTTTYPTVTETSVGGFNMQNAANESCGGTLIEAFAVSCDTTFAPLGIEIGAKHLLSEAEAFGFNHATGITSALESQLPTTLTRSDATAIGMTAIGQGELEASPLEMADVGAAIADHGQRPIPTFVDGAKPTFVTATTAKVAGEVQTMMEAVTSSAYDGTGTTAQIPGYQVAGKTGTAELASTANQANDTKETDAWFVGYVPDSKAGIVVCALFPEDGYGADSAAPAVREVLEDALGVS